MGWWPYLVKKLGLAQKKTELVLNNTLTWPLTPPWAAPWADSTENKERMAGCVSNGLPLRSWDCGGKCLSGYSAGQRTVWRRGELICKERGKKWKNSSYLLAPISKPLQFPAFKQTQREENRKWSKGLNRRRRSKWMWEGRDPQG